MKKTEIIKTLEEVLQGIQELKAYAQSSKFSQDERMNANDVVMRCNEIIDTSTEFHYWRNIL